MAKIQVVHILHGGYPLCEFSHGYPRDWPAGHKWIALAEYLALKRAQKPPEKLCAQCKHEMAKR